VHNVFTSAILIRYERCPNTGNFVGHHAGSQPTATDGDTAVDLSAGNSPGHGNHEVLIVVAIVRLISAKILNLSSSACQFGCQHPLQFKSAVIGGNAESHGYSIPIILQDIHSRGGLSGAPGVDPQPLAKMGSSAPTVGPYAGK
jgi:hypothetical protein